jgi:phage tail-like protein
VGRGNVMAVQRDRPYHNANFVVDLGDGPEGGGATGFAEVVFPAFGVTQQAQREGDASLPAPAGPASGAPERLILRRGVTGALDVYAWWHKARSGKAPKRRTVRVHLLAEDHASVVLTWRFRHARPVSLSYSPLRALDGSVLIETLELEFDRVEMV